MVKVFIVAADLKTAEEHMDDLHVAREDWQFVNHKKEIRKKIYKEIPFYIVFGYVNQKRIDVINYLYGKGNVELENSKALLNYLKETK
jgi:hypothetical protein